MYGWAVKPEHPGPQTTKISFMNYDKEDLQRIASYFKRAPSSPIVLRQYVWYNLSIHFISRGLEFHHQLRTWIHFTFKRMKMVWNTQRFVMKHNNKISRVELDVMKLHPTNEFMKFQELIHVQ